MANKKQRVDPNSEYLLDTPGLKSLRVGDTPNVVRNIPFEYIPSKDDGKVTPGTAGTAKGNKYLNPIV
jgi:hypothetical protein